MATFAFSSAELPDDGYGQLAKVRLAGTWADGDQWTLSFVSTLSGDFTIGKGNIAGEAMSCALKIRGRVYMGIGTAFCLSAIDNPTGWEEQNAGAARIEYVSQYGPQDTVMALASIQGRLAVFGKQSTQIWSIDADPANLALQQTLDNVGTLAMLSVQSIGDLDVMYLDNSGIRSLRSKQDALNASVEDVGAAIDLSVRADLLDFTASQACAIVEPTTKQYWIYINGKIYVLSNYPASKVTAWSTFKPTYEATISPSAGTFPGGGSVTYTTVVGGIYYWTKGDNGVELFKADGTTTILDATGGFVATETSVIETGVVGQAVDSTLKRVDTSFTPEKFVVYDKQVYVRASNGKIFRYGGSNRETYDACRAIVELPWYDFKSPSTYKQAHGIDIAISGNWKVEAGLDPIAGTLTEVINQGSAVSPSMDADSTFDSGHYGYSAHGTHLKLKMTSGIVPTAAKLGKIVFLYDNTNRK